MLPHDETERVVGVSRSESGDDSDGTADDPPKIHSGDGTANDPPAEQVQRRLERSDKSMAYHWPNRGRTNGQKVMSSPEQQWVIQSLSLPPVTALPNSALQRACPAARCPPPPLGTTST